MIMDKEYTIVNKQLNFLAKLKMEVDLELLKLSPTSSDYNTGQELSMLLADIISRQTYDRKQKIILNALRNRYQNKL